MAHVIVTRRPARPGVLRSPCARLRRSASADRRARRRILPRPICCGLTDGIAEDAGMGRRDHRHPGRDHPPPRDRIRHHQTGGAADRLRARPHRVSASSSIAPPTRWPRSPAMSASPAAIPAPATAPPDAAASTACRPAATRSTHASRPRCSPTCWRAARPAAIRPTSS